MAAAATRASSAAAASAARCQRALARRTALHCTAVNATCLQQVGRQPDEERQRRAPRTAVQLDRDVGQNRDHNGQHDPLRHAAAHGDRVPAYGDGCAA